MRTDLPANLAALEAKLLAIGGEALAGPPSWLEMELQAEFVAALLERGEVMSGEDAKLRKAGMRAISCHQNAAALARRFDSYEHWTGVALSTDGLWRVHSWCVSPFAVIETTTPRLYYFGRPASEDPAMDE